MLKEREIQIVNEGVYNELFASHLYKKLATICLNLGYKGFANFFRKEYKNEVEHFEKWQNFANAMSVEIVIPMLPMIDFTSTSIDEIVKKALDTEKELLKKYEDDYDNVESSTKICSILLQLINIQVESVGEYTDISQRLKLGDKLLIDKELL